MEGSAFLCAESMSIGTGFLGVGVREALNVGVVQRERIPEDGGRVMGAVKVLWADWKALFVALFWSTVWAISYH